MALYSAQQLFHTHMYISCAYAIVYHTAYIRMYVRTEAGRGGVGLKRK